MLLRPPCRSAHLTNDAVQINFDHYGSFEDANKLTMEALQELFAGQVGLALATCLTQGPRSDFCRTPHTPPHYACWSLRCQAPCQDSKPLQGAAVGLDWQHRHLPGMRAARDKFAESDLLPC